MTVITNRASPLSVTRINCKKEKRAEMSQEESFNGEDFDMSLDFEMDSKLDKVSSLFYKTLD